MFLRWVFCLCFCFFSCICVKRREKPASVLCLRHRMKAIKVIPLRVRDLGSPGSLCGKVLKCERMANAWRKQFARKNKGDVRTSKQVLNMGWEVAITSYSNVISFRLHDRKTIFSRTFSLTFPFHFATYRSLYQDFKNIGSFFHLPVHEYDITREHGVCNIHLWGLTTSHS